MDASLLGLIAVIGVVVIFVLAFRRRHRRGSPLIINSFTRIVEPNADALGRLPVVQPMPPITTAQKADE